MRPGRPEQWAGGGKPDDRHRTCTAGEALAAVSGLWVIGRPLTRSDGTGTRE